MAIGEVIYSDRKCRIETENIDRVRVHLEVLISLGRIKSAMERVEVDAFEVVLRWPFLTRFQPSRARVRQTPRSSRIRTASKISD